MYANMGLTRFFNSTTVNIESNQMQGPVPIKVNVCEAVSRSALLENELEKVRSAIVPDCFYPKAHKRPHAQRWAGVRKDMMYSMWKLNAVARSVRGL